MDVALGTLALGARGSAAIVALFAHGRGRLQCPGRAHRVGEIAGQGFDVELLAGQPLDVAQQRPLVIGAERNRDARAPARAVRPMRWTYCSATCGKS